MAYVGVLALACVPLSWLTHAVIDAREDARSSQCVSNLKQIGLALHNYHAEYGCFPPAYVTDAKGKPLYSWRVLILPFLEQNIVYRQIRLDQPWDSPHNRRVSWPHFRSFQCPSDPAGDGSTETHFVAVVGPGTVFPSDGRSRRLADVGDGTNDTLILAEVAGTGIHWMEPRDLDWRTMSFRLNDGGRPSVSSHHPFRGSSYPGPHVLRVDGAVSYLSRDLPQATLRALLTIAGGEEIDRREWYRHP